MTEIDEVILCDNKAKNAGITCLAPTGAIDAVRLFNEVSVHLPAVGRKERVKTGRLFLHNPKQIN